MNARRNGITLVECVVVIGILGVLMAILIPATQSIRESSRRVICQNNLRQIATLILNHESAHKRLPSLYNGTFLTQQPTTGDEFHFHSWRVAVLPALEQGALYDRIDQNRAATDPQNLANLATSLSVFVCPSTSNVSVDVPEIGVYNGNRPTTAYIGPAARSDYEAVTGLLPAPHGNSFSSLIESVIPGPWGDVNYLSGQTFETGFKVRTQRDGRFRDTVDGLSHTVIVGERAGRPDYYRDGKLVDAYPYDDRNIGLDAQQAAWGVSTSYLQLLYSDKQTVNGSNADGPFAFHTAGANVALGDGSVRLLSTSTSTKILNALVTRSSGDDASLE